MVVIIAALIAAMSLVRTNQNTQKGAYFADTTLKLLPDTKTVAVGDTLNVDLWVDSPAKVDFVQTKICFNDKLSLPTDLTALKARIMPKAPFAAVLLANYTNNCLEFSTKAEVESSQLSAGAVAIATLQFNAVNVGTVPMTIVSESSQVSGFNTNTTSVDNSIRVAGVTGGTYTVVQGNSTSTITPVPTAGDGPKLKFRVVMGGVRDFSDVNSTCAKDIKMDLIAVALSGLTKSYNQIPMTKVGVVNYGTSSDPINYAVWQGEVNMVGFSPSDSVSLLVKGPRHVWMKYGEDGQNKYFNQLLGKLSIKPAPFVNDFDFSHYPLLPGDINTDEIVNGTDYVDVVNKFGTSGSGIDDLDYNCVVNANDLQLVKITLNERQSQKY